MSRNSDPGSVSRRQFLAAAGTIATASSFAMGKDSDSAQTTTPTTCPAVTSTTCPAPTSTTPVDHVVTIKVNGTGTLTYCVNDSQGKCVDLVPPNYDLCVNPRDSVKWAVKGAYGKYTVAIGFFKTPDTPLVDGNADDLYSVYGKNSATQEGIIASTASGAYCYSVRVHDKNGWHPDDPRIIIGKSDASEMLKEAQDQLSEVKGKIEVIEKELKEAMRECRKQSQTKDTQKKN